MARYLKVRARSRVRVLPWVLLAAVCLMSAVGCGKSTYLCDVHSYEAPYGYINFVGTYDYSGDSAADATAACEDDWSSFYRCTNCTEE